MLGTGGDIVTGTSELEDEDIGNEVLKGRGPRMEGNEWYWVDVVGPVPRIGDKGQVWKKRLEWSQVGGIEVEGMDDCYLKGKIDSVKITWREV